MYPRGMPGYLPFAARCVVGRAHTQTQVPRRCSRVALVGLFVVTTVLGVSCRRRVEPTQKSNSAASGSVANALPLAPLQAPGHVVDISVRGQSDAVLQVPVGATVPKPLVAVLLPSATALRAQCEAVGQGIAVSAFVLCHSTMVEPKSVPAAASSDLVASELRAAMRETKRKFGQYVAKKELALVGLGEAADAIAPIVRRDPEVFQRIALLDGGFAAWTAVDSSRFAGGGGKALLARCSLPGCRDDAMRVIATVRALGIATQLLPEMLIKEIASAHAGAKGRAAEEPQPLLLKWLLAAGEPTADRTPEAVPNPNKHPAK